MGCGSSSHPVNQTNPALKLATNDMQGMKSSERMKATDDTNISNFDVISIKPKEEIPRVPSDSMNKVGAAETGGSVSWDMTEGESASVPPTLSEITAVEEFDKSLTDICTKLGGKFIIPESSQAQGQIAANPINDTYISTLFMNQIESEQTLEILRPLHYAEDDLSSVKDLANPSAKCTTERSNNQAENHSYVSIIKKIEHTYDRMYSIAPKGVTLDFLSEHEELLSECFSAIGILLPVDKFIEGISYRHKSIQNIESFFLGN